MKIPTIALTTLALLAATHTDAFAPRTTNTKASPDIAAASSSALFTATVSSAARVGVDLGLVYTPVAPFGKNAPETALGADAKKVLGGKGANLAEMSELGLSVPPGFTITTECCDRYCGGWDKSLPSALWEEIVKSIDAVQDEMNSEFGSPENPLLLSVRSGAAISMPGMVRQLYLVFVVRMGPANVLVDLCFALVKSSFRGSKWYGLSNLIVVCLLIWNLTRMFLCFFIGVRWIPY
jgi:hypothetical protein